MTGRTVLFVQATNAAAYPPLLNAGALFAEAGWRTVYLSAPIAGQTLEFPSGSPAEARTFAPRTSHVWRKSAYGRYCWEAVATARSVRPDLVYASDPIGAMPGLLAAWAVGARLIYHEHDSPTSQGELHPLMRAARRKAIATASQVVFPNAARAEHCLAELGLPASRSTIVWNTPLRSEVTPPKRGGTCPFVVYYHGSVTPARLSPSAVEAVARFSGRAVLRMVGYEAPGAAGYVAELAARYGTSQADGLVDWRGEVPTRAEMLRLAAEADLGISLMPMASSDINAMCMSGASNKLFDYMAAGLPVLVSSLPDWQRAFVRPGHAIGVKADDPDSIAHALRLLIDQPRLREEIGRRNRQRILDEWNYETCFAPVLEAACR